jgi:hypothetical protein
MVCESTWPEDLRSLKSGSLSATEPELVLDDVVSKQPIGLLWTGASLQ